MSVFQSAMKGSKITHIMSRHYVSCSFPARGWVLCLGEYRGQRNRDSETGRGRESANGTRRCAPGESRAFKSNHLSPQTDRAQTGMFAIAMFLMKDWRNSPGTAEVLPYLDKVRAPRNLTLAMTERSVLPCIWDCRQITRVSEDNGRDRSW